jgi:hypothetical protein
MFHSEFINVVNKLITEFIAGATGAVHVDEVTYASLEEGLHSFI